LAAGGGGQLIESDLSLVPTGPSALLVQPRPDRRSLDAPLVDWIVVAQQRCFDAAGLDASLTPRLLTEFALTHARQLT
jgi:hypothetical protein